ncbi:hypothetical protein Y032_0071g558 [Ancylostoma ceylanicum]|uniref:Uncharacterized protein n=1 Tax=Ancylostoma ceylanicum TaxID=53326 RepID=A0A016TW36_9BILA|nr:hypothetical protein Y032_0071g558 [Ancylostoma ceylanicum]
MVEIAILSIFAGQTRPIRKSGWLKIFPGAFMNPTADAQFLFQPNNTFLFAHYGAMFFIADHDCPYHEAPSGSINRIVSTRRRNDKRCHCCINIFGLQLPLSDLFVLFR